MSKYIDLEDTLLQSCHKAHDYPFVMDVKIVLAWLDNHPDQVPGRTITEGDLIAAVDETNHEDMNEYQKARALLVHLGYTIPDPEPTNAGHDRDWWVENANVNDAEDCEACGGDLCPVHYGISMGIDLMAKKIAALGDDPELFALIPDPAKAPGGDDDRHV